VVSKSSSVPELPGVEFATEFVCTDVQLVQLAEVFVEAPGASLTGREMKIDKCQHDSWKDYVLTEINLYEVDGYTNF